MRRDKRSFAGRPNPRGERSAPCGWSVRPRDHEALRRPFPVTYSITRRAGVAEMVEAVRVVEQEALGRGAVVVEAEARAAQPMICEGSWCQNRHGSRSPWVFLLTFVRTTLRVPLDLSTRSPIGILTKSSVGLLRGLLAYWSMF